MAEKINRCRDCKYIHNFNPYSDRYWHCMKYVSNYTQCGWKAVKRMNKSCEHFKEKE